jgi:hypothetical protein
MENKSVEKLNKYLSENTSEQLKSDFKEIMKDYKETPKEKYINNLNKLEYQRQKFIYFIVGLLLGSILYSIFYL